MPTKKKPKQPALDVPQIQDPVTPETPVALSVGNRLINLSPMKWRHVNSIAGTAAYLCYNNVTDGTWEETEVPGCLNSIIEDEITYWLPEQLLTPLVMDDATRKALHAVCYEEALAEYKREMS